MYTYTLYIYIHTYKYIKNRMDIFFVHYGFYLKRTFLFGSIACFGVWLWRVVQILWQQRVRTSSDSLQKRKFSQKWSKLGVVIGYPNLATNTAIFATTAPNTVSRRDTHTVGTSEMNPRFHENYWPVTEVLQPDMAVFGTKRNGQTRTYGFPGICIYIYIIICIHIWLFIFIGIIYPYWERMF